MRWSATPHPEADLLQVKGAEPAPDGDPPRPRAIACAQGDLDGAVVVLLHGQGRGECRPRRRGTGIAHDALGDPVLSPAAGRQGEVGELKLGAAAAYAGGIDGGVHVQSDRLDADDGVHEHSGGGANPKTNAVDGQ